MHGSRRQCVECGGFFSVVVLQDMDGSPQCSVDSLADYREECRSAVLAQAWKHKSLSGSSIGRSENVF